MVAANQYLSGEFVIQILLNYSWGGEAGFRRMDAGEFPK